MHKWELCDIARKEYPDGGVVERASKEHSNPDLNFEDVFDSTRTDMSDYLAYNGSIANPRLGTVRVSYEAVLDGGDLSLVAVQCRGGTFRPFTERDAHAQQPEFLKMLFCVRPYDEPSSGGSCCCVSLAEAIAGSVVGKSILLVEERDTAPEVLFHDESVKFLTRLYLSRLAGCLGISLGIYLIFNPISALLSFIPYVSMIISNLFFIVAMVVGFAIGAAVIALSWVLHRPEYMLGSCAYYLLYRLI